MDTTREILDSTQFTCVRLCVRACARAGGWIQVNRMLAWRVEDRFAALEAALWVKTCEEGIAKVHVARSSAERGERERRRELELTNAYLHDEIEQLRATAQRERTQVERQHEQMARRLQVLEQELEATRRGGGAIGQLHDSPHEDVPPAIAIAQQPPNAVLQIIGAGSPECNGFYKDDGKTRWLANYVVGYDYAR